MNEWMNGWMNEWMMEKGKEKGRVDSVLLPRKWKSRVGEVWKSDATYAYTSVMMINECKWLEISLKWKNKK